MRKSRVKKHLPREIMPFATTWMNLTLREISKADKDKYRMIHFYVECKNVKPIQTE